MTRKGAIFYLRTDVTLQYGGCLFLEEWYMPPIFVQFALWSLGHDFTFRTADSHYGSHQTSRGFKNSFQTRIVTGISSTKISCGWLTPQLFQLQFSFHWKIAGIVTQGCSRSAGNASWQSIFFTLKIGIFNMQHSMWSQLVVINWQTTAEKQINNWFPVE